MNKTPKKIDLAEWELFGGGYTASSCYCKNDDRVMLKLYAPFMDKEEGLRELESSEKIYNLGIQCAKPLEYVTDGKSFGAVFERIKNKKSFARIVADEPERAKEIGELFAIEAKKMHSLVANQAFIPNAKKRMANLALNNKFISESQREKALLAINNTPDSVTCLHGDCHIGNILLANDKIYWIDLGDFSYGSPLFDLGVFCFLSLYCNEDRQHDMFHITRKQMEEVFYAFIGEYFKGQAKEDVLKMLLPYVGVAGLFFSDKSKSLSPDLKGAVEAAFGK